MTTIHPGADDARAQIAEIIRIGSSQYGTDKGAEITADAILAALTSGHIAISQGGGVLDEDRAALAKRMREHVIARGGPAHDRFGKPVGGVWQMMLDAADMLAAAPSPPTASPAERDGVKL